MTGGGHARCAFSDRLRKVGSRTPASRRVASVSGSLRTCPPPPLSWFGAGGQSCCALDLHTCGILNTCVRGAGGEAVIL